jgi:hypothetical protein
LEISLPDFENDSNQYNSVAEMSFQLIKSQQELKHFTLRESHYTKTIGNALKYQNSSLRHVEFIEIFFDNCELNWLSNCEQLESLKFVDSQNSTILTPFQLHQLKSLIFEENPLPTEILEVLIRSSSKNLREIVLGLPSDFAQNGHPPLLYIISKFCPNLTKLGATICDKEMESLFQILKNCKFLQCLEIYGDGYIVYVNEILPKLGNYIPSTFSEFDIRARWRFNAEDLKCFLDNIKHVSLCRFVIKIHDFINDDHLSVIENHSIKSLKYITFGDKNFPVTQEGMSETSKWLRTFLYYY